jgi:hypothetical protein
MPSRTVILGNEGDGEEIRGNNVAIFCPASGCGKVFMINTTTMDNGKRSCPKCNGSKVTLQTKEPYQGAKVFGALIEWD